MADVKNFGLKGIANDVRFGKSGARAISAIDGSSLELEIGGSPSAIFRGGSQSFYANGTEKLQINPAGIAASGGTFSDDLALSNNSATTPRLVFDDTVNDTQTSIDMASEKWRISSVYQGGAASTPLMLDLATGELSVPGGLHSSGGMYFDGAGGSTWLTDNGLDIVSPSGIVFDTGINDVTFLYDSGSGAPWIISEADLNLEAEAGTIKLISTAGAQVIVGSTQVLEVTSAGVSILGRTSIDTTTGVEAMAVKNVDATDGTWRTTASFKNASDVQVGTIDVTSTATRYQTSSDYRLKENIVPIAKEKALSAIDALNPVNFTWKGVPGGNEFWGFIAHEVQEVYPDAVSGSKDAVRHAYGKTQDEYQSMDQSMLTAINTAGIKALLEIIRQQQIDIDELKGRKDNG